MLDESRRSAYLKAMEVDLWLPRQDLPGAAPGRVIAPLPSASAAASAASVVTARPPRPAPEVAPSPRPAVKAEQQQQQVPAPAQPASAPAPQVEEEPRFSLQLAPAGNCLVLVELPTGEALQHRDPGHLLLRDLLRAAGLPDRLQWQDDPLRWPACQDGYFGRGPAAAREFVHEYLSSRCELRAPRCVWLLGDAARRYLGGADSLQPGVLGQVPGIGPVWPLPGLDALLASPQRKAELWRWMREVRRQWQEAQ